MQSALTDKEQMELLICPLCRTHLDLFSERLHCRHCDKDYKVIDGIPVLLPGLSEDEILSQGKWESGYRNLDYKVALEQYKNLYLNDTVRQISEYYKPKKGDNYLEIGCGPAFLGTYFARQGLNIFGIDISLSALRIAKKIYQDMGIDNCFF
ncbi:MAG: methyltransferase domain-containing protein, partial [Candidatus Omnitrophota bacterium]